MSITAPTDKTQIMASKEKKENIRMGKQTATVYAAKIKTKIHSKKCETDSVVCRTDVACALIR